MTFKPFLDALRDPWRLEAECREMSPDEFFVNPGSAIPKATREACERCRVRLDCLDYALVNHIKQGFWGGQSAQSRKGMKPRKAQP
jgi:WhiB family redox-sensing transcriptional regulator